MGKMIKIEDRRHDVVDQIAKLIHDAYPPILGYYVDYYIGKDSEELKKVLCFEIKSTRLGNIYRKTFRLAGSGNMYDYEADFIGNIMSDFIMLGTTFLTNQIMAKNQHEPVKENVRDVLKNPFSKGRLNKVNLN